MPPHFDYIDSGTRYIALSMTAINSACLIGLSTLLMRIGEAPAPPGLKNADIAHVSNYISTTRRAIAKRMAPFDSAHQIGLSTFSNGILIIV